MRSDRVVLFIFLLVILNVVISEAKRGHRSRKKGGKIHSTGSKANKLNNALANSKTSKANKDKENGDSKDSDKNDKNDALQLASLGNLVQYATSDPLSPLTGLKIIPGLSQF